MLPHEKLEVYRKALDFVGGASAAAVLWDKRHAVADQFARASDTKVSAEPKALGFLTICEWANDKGSD